MCCWWLLLTKYQILFALCFFAIWYEITEGGNKRILFLVFNVTKLSNALSNHINYLNIKKNKMEVITSSVFRYPKQY